MRIFSRIGSPTTSTPATPAPIGYQPGQGDTITINSQSGGYTLTWTQFTELVGTSGTGGSAASYIYVTQTGNYTLPNYSTGELATDGVSKNYIITGNSLNTLNIPTATAGGSPVWISGNGNPLDNTKTNLVYTQSINGRVIYSVTYVVLPDTIVPSFLANTVSNITSTTATYNPQVSETGSVKWILTASSTSPAEATIIAANNINMSGTTPNTANITGLTASTTYYLHSLTIDSAGNKSAIQSPITVTTQAAAPPYANTRSLSVANMNQVPRSGDNPTLLTFPGTAPFSYSARIKLSTLGTDMMIAALTPNVANTNAGHNFFKIDDVGRVALSLGSGGSLSNTIGRYITTGITAGSWFHIVGTYGGGTTSAAIKLYVNATEPATLTSTVGTYSQQGVDFSNTIFMIGGSNYIFPQVAVNMLIDDMIIYDKELSGAEITDLYNNPPTVSPITLSTGGNIRALYRFEQNLNDFSSNLVNLTSPNAPTYSTDHP